ncbi:MAG TPA: cytochrome P460 family protein [Acidobacteriota bacterium]|nr:cytochrome P460 family protein [Acidobacteriota bacterium]
MQAAPAPSTGQTTLDAALLRANPRADGSLIFPDSYRQWIFVGSATGLAYGEPSETRRHGDPSDRARPGPFTHVYLEPEAYEHFRQTGQFQEGTDFALEMRAPTTGVSIARGGWFAGHLQGVHASIKDTQRFGGWAYFDVDSSGVARRVRTPACATCHAEHGQIDNVFVQFYPLLTEAVHTNNR